MAGNLQNDGPDFFSGFHPAVLLLYFCGVLFFGMFSLHPVVLLITFFSEFFYSILLSGGKALKFDLCMLPVTLAVALLNPLLNHAGATILFYLNGNPVTWEAIVAGANYALAFLAVLLTFSCFNRIMTSDKLMYLFGKLIPVLSLIFSMTLRFVPRYKAQIKKIAKAQKCIGKDPGHGNLLRRTENGVRILSVLITWALENAVETADSMKARGFGLKGRTSFSIYSWEKKDGLLLTVELAALLTALAGLAFGKFRAVYFPTIRIAGLDGTAALFDGAYAVFCLLPIAVDGKEALLWNRLKLPD
jgi:energy-coupling factor transport system permease protein